MDEANPTTAKAPGTSATGADSEVSKLSKTELITQITELAGQLNAANYRWLVLIAEFDRRNAWSDGATQSCAHWLSWKCGLDMCAAREKVRVAHALERLPKVSQAMSCGQLSYSKVRALTRVATEATEEVLLNVALHGTTEHVEELVRRFRQVQEIKELSRVERQYANRGLSHFFDDDGSLVIKLRLPAEGGSLLLKALELALPDIPLPGESPPHMRPSKDSVESSPSPSNASDVREHSAGRSDRLAEDSQNLLHDSAESSPRPRSTLQPSHVSFAARRADALIVVVESFLAHGAAALKGGDRHQIVVHIDEATLKKREAGACEFEDGPSTAIETARRLACDASKVEITEDEQGEPLSVGRKTRTIPPALCRALRSRDQGCVFPGCAHKRYVDAHHIEHWADGGETKLSNLVSLCRFHHRAVHEGGIRVERCDDGAWRFAMKSGELVSSCAPSHTRAMWTPSDVAKGNADHGLRITPNAGATKWTGERMDYGVAIDSLLYRTRRATEGAAAQTAAPAPAT
jgi:hypothetical protein